MGAMFVRTSPQRGLFETDTLLSEKGRALLKRSWAELFARDVLPRLLELEPRLAPLYSNTGRPNWSVARMLGLVLLRELLGLGSDREVVEALAFDARFQHALGLPPDEAYLSRRSLVDFRRRFQTNGSVLAREVFDAVTAAAITALNIDTSTQRVDSTFITSNIALRGRTALLTEAMERLLDELGPERRERLEADIRGWYGDQDGWDSKLNFEQVARWLHRVLREFRNDADVAASQPYQLALNVFSQHVRLTPRGQADDDEPSDPDDDPPTTPCAATSDEKRKSRAKTKTKAQRKARRKQRPKGELDLDAVDEAFDVEADTEHGVDRMQSLHDQDARLGQKGTGYLAQLSETCGNSEVELIVDLAVSPANASDTTALPAIVESLAERGRTPTVLLADAGYTSTDNLVHCAERGIELLGPVRRLPVQRTLDRNDFQYDEAGTVAACPEGHAPIEHRALLTSSHPVPQPHALFDHATCHECPRRSECPVSNHRGNATRLAIGDGIRRRDARLREQKTPDFRSRYADRSGIEACNSELKRAHALDRITIRGGEKVYVRVALKAAACNIKRWHVASRKAA